MQTLQTLERMQEMLGRMQDNQVMDTDLWHMASTEFYNVCGLFGHDATNLRRKHIFLGGDRGDHRGYGHLPESIRVT